MDWSSVLPAVLTVAGGAASVTIAAWLNHRHERRFADQARRIGWLEDLSQILNNVVIYFDAAAEVRYRGQAAPDDVPPMHLLRLMEQFQPDAFRAEHLVNVINDEKLTACFDDLMRTTGEFTPPDGDRIDEWRLESWDSEMLGHRKSMRDEISRLLTEARNV